MKDNGYEITVLPVYSNNIPPNGEMISRVLKEKGELTRICITPSNYIAYVTFPKGGVPRANHFHEKKHEYIYLIKGKIKVYIRRGGCLSDSINVITLSSGSIIYIKPGWAHAIETIEGGYGIEFSPTNYDIIEKDSIRDYVLP